jgi:hypothetical protein
LYITISLNTKAGRHEVEETPILFSSVFSPHDLLDNQICDVEVLMDVVPPFLPVPPP